MEHYPERIDSRFRFVLLAAERAEQLMRGASPKIETPATQPTEIAMDEIASDLIEWGYGPPPEAEVDAETVEG